MLYFLLFLFLFIVFPSWIVFCLFSITEKDILILLGLLLGWGMCAFTVLVALVRLLGFSEILLWILPGISCIVFFSVRKKFFQHQAYHVQKQHLWFLFLILLGVIAQNIVLYRGGLSDGETYVFPSMHDTMWNIALTQEVFYHFPPEHPGFAGVSLKNNHFFYPLFLATVERITHLDIFDLYFRFGPLLISFLFGLSIYTVSTIFTKSMLFRGIALFLGYFSGNASFFLPLFFGASFNWQGNTFLSDQPFDQIINPYSVFGFSIFLLSIYTIWRMKEKKMLKAWGAVTAVLVGTLYGFKSFGGIILFGSFLVSTCLTFFRERNIVYLFPIALAGSIFSFTFFSITEAGSVKLAWFPGWILTEMMAGSDKLNIPYFIQVEAYYQAIGNWLGLLKIKGIELVIYIAGNFGTRLLGIVYLLQIALGYLQKKTTHPLFFFYVIGTFSLSVGLPLLTNLGGNAHNIVQFTPYALLLSSLLMVSFLEEIFFWFVQRRKQSLGIVCVVMVMLLSIPVNIKNIVEKLQEEPDYLTIHEVHALSFLQEHTDPKEIILIRQEDSFFHDPIYISALARRRLFLASPYYARQTGIDPTERLEDSKGFFAYPTRSFLREHNISYIYRLRKKIGNEDIFDRMMTGIGGKKFFENQDVLIYSVL